MKSPTPKAGASHNARGPKASKNSTSAASDGGGIERLKPTPYNPRLPWQGTQGDDFKRSLEEFGDLSGVVLNIRSGHLVGGNKRTDAFREAKDTQVVDCRDAKDKQGTVRVGYVLVNGTRFAYREVDWDEQKERLANIAANKWSAAWDDSTLAQMLKDITDSGLDVALAGFDSFDMQRLIEATAIPGENKQIDEQAMSQTEHECPKCGFKW